MKVYGRDTGTQLRLTEKAQKAYDMTEPLTIVQYFFPGKMDNVWVVQVLTSSYRQIVWHAGNKRI